MASEERLRFLRDQGLAIAMLLLLGVRYWPAILVGAFFVNVTTDGSIITSAIIAVGNTLEAITAVLLMEMFAGGKRAFESVQTILGFTFFAALARSAGLRCRSDAEIAAPGDGDGDEQP